MTIGISKEKLEKVLSGNAEYKMSQPYINAQRKLLMAMIDCCEELNPWLPIDENTPKDRPILLFYPAREPYDSIIKADYYSEFYGLCTKWQELPANPK